MNQAVREKRFDEYAEGITEAYREIIRQKDLQIAELKEQIRILTPEEPRFDLE